MTKKGRIERLEMAIYELATLLGYKFDFNSEYLIPKPLPWTPTIVEQLSVIRKELGIRIKLNQPQVRSERIEVKKEKKNAKK